MVQTSAEYAVQCWREDMNTDFRFLKGRLRFGNAKNSAPFPSMVVIFRKAGRCR